VKKFVEKIGNLHIVLTVISVLQAIGLVISFSERDYTKFGGELVLFIATLYITQRKWEEYQEKEKENKQ
jgi:hypothetical protein